MNRGGAEIAPRMHPGGLDATAPNLRRLQGFISIGETGFEPATARPPAGAIQAYPALLDVLEPVELP